MKFSVLFLCLAAVSFGASAVRPDRLRCEYRANPQGIDATAPRLSWQLAAVNTSARGLRQSAYRILVASSEQALRNNQGDLWDTGKVSSDQSIQVVYRGKALTSGEAAFWKVQVWDQGGSASGWSAPAQWTMGLLSPGDWHGQWIGDETAPAEDPSDPYSILRGAHWIWVSDHAQQGAPAGESYYRDTFIVPAGRQIVRAMCIAGASTEAQIFVNGEEINARSAAGLPDVMGISHLVHAGQNVIAVRALNGTNGGPAGLIGAVRVEFSTGEPLIVPTSNQWRASSKVESGWEQPGYLDTAWQPAKDLGALGIQPWGMTPVTESHRLASRMLRKEFGIEKKVKRASVYFTGLGLSELYLNGAKVGDAVLTPALTDYDKHVLYVTYDVTRQIVSGRNAIGIILGNGRFYAPRAGAVRATRSFDYPKALLELDIEYEDGSHSHVVTDTGWKLTTNGPIRADNEYDGEEYDARREMPGWDRAGFNDSSWQAAQAVRAPGGVVAAQMDEPLRVIQTIHPISVHKLAAGVYIFDMGQNMVGWCRLHVSGPRGTQVQLRHAETLRPDGSLYTDNLRTARATDLYTLKGGAPEIWEPRFTYHGFRYVEVTGYPGEPTTASIEGRVVHDDMEKTADFVSSNDLLNKIHHNIFWGVSSNYRSIPTDCPQRDERQGWLGDRSQVSLSESYLYNVAAFYSKWETDLADSEHPDGSVPAVAPNFWQIYNDDITWPSTFIFVPGMLYQQYGDLRTLERNYPAMKKWIEHMRGYLKDGLMPRDKYGDWCVPPESPKLIHSIDPARITDGTLLGTSYYYYLLRIMSRYARLLDNPVDASEFDTLASTIDQAFQKAYFKPLTGLYDNGTQTSSILPLYFGMVPPEDRAAVVKGLTTRIEDESHGHVGTGLVGAQWLMRTLTENGHSDIAYQIATQKTYPGLGYMVEQGATTVWELWNGNTADPAMNSGNHVMQIGDMGVWMYEYLAGIRSDPEKPGFKHILIRPYPAGDLTSVKASHRSPYGLIATSWKRTPSRFDLDVTVPPNTTATIWVPTKSADGITESGHSAKSVRGLHFVRTDGSTAVFEAESGSYRFSSAL
ncbi:MAG TPA: family 78 glycoside hydrolase catalytic domain [Bryobacteraceae bacterium]|nr:family 78 glycoside hydrolase catalytic domain [Bryobacteraceae bacterium]